MTVSSSQFYGGSKPLRITTLTSGSGNYAPLSPGNFVKVTLQAGGAGGGQTTKQANAPGGCGGNAGSCIIFWTKIPGTVSYIVGAGGLGGTDTGGVNVDGTNGGHSFFYTVWAEGGNAGTVPTVAPTDQVLLRVDGFYAGGSGGPGGAYQASGVRALAVGSGSTNVLRLGGFGGLSGALKGGGGGGGGDSLFGRGGNGGAGDVATGTAGSGTNGTGYGSGGGGSGGVIDAGGSVEGVGGNGAGGYIIIEEYQG